MGGVRGDFEGLADLKRRMASIEKERFRIQLSKGLAEESRRLVHEGFTREVDPEDVPWKPSWSPNTLRDTGRLRNSIATHAWSRGFTLSTNVKYAAIHQYGGIIKAKNATSYSFRGRKRIGKVIGAGGTKPIWQQAAGRTFRAGGKPMLRWQGAASFRFAGASGRLKRPMGNRQWFSAEQVEIPRRRFIPEGNIGHRWTTSLGNEATRIMVKQMGADF